MRLMEFVTRLFTRDQPPVVFVEVPEVLPEVRRIQKIDPRRIDPETGEIRGGGIDAFFYGMSGHKDVALKNQSVQPGPLSGVRFTITGPFAYDRSELVRMANELGATVGGVSGYTTHLLVSEWDIPEVSGKEHSCKYYSVMDRNARMPPSMQIKIIGMKEFAEMVGCKDLVEAQRKFLNRRVTEVSPRQKRRKLH